MSKRSEFAQRSLLHAQCSLLVTCAPYLRNLVVLEYLSHTRLTYHRTWETGLRVAIRVTAFSPAFFLSWF